MSSVLHTFFDCHMGIGHKGMKSLLVAKAKVEDLRRGETAVFVNKGWTAAKILYPGGHIHYYRSPNAAVMTAEQLRALPTRMPSTKLNFGAGFAKVMKTNERFFELGKQLRAVGS